MTTSCDETPVLHETSKQGSFVFELWIAKEMCLDVDTGETTVTGAPIFVRVTNQGLAEAQMVAADPDAVHVSRIWDADRIDQGLDIDRDPVSGDIATQTVSIAPGASWDTTPVENSLSFLTPDLLDGNPISGGKIAIEDRLRRIIGLEVTFSAKANTGTGFVPFEQKLIGQITAVSRPDTQ